MSTKLLLALAVAVATVSLAPAASAEPAACSELLDGDAYCGYYVVCVGPDTSTGWRTCDLGVEDPRYWPCTCDPYPPIFTWD